MNQTDTLQDPFTINKLFDYETIFGLLDHLHEGVVIHRNDTSIAYANTAAFEILGLSHEEIIGKKAIDDAWYFLDESLSRIDVQDYPINKLFSSGENIVHQLMAVHTPDQSLKWVDINATIVTDKVGLKNALVVFSDVTERKKAYDEASLFKRVIETVDTGITIADPSQEDMPLIYVNPGFTAMTGYSYEEAVGKNCRYLQGDNREQEVRFEIARSLEKQSSCNVELENYTKSGDLFYNLLTLSPLKDEGNLRYYVGVQHDISKIKHQEFLLKEQNRFIESILDAQDEIIFVHQNKKINYANKSFLDFFEFDSLEAFLTKNDCVCSYFLPDELAFFPNGDLSDWFMEIMSVESEKRIVAIKRKNTLHYLRVSVIQSDTSFFKVTLSDITKNFLQQKKLESKAYHDSLTGVFNRQYFYDFVLEDPRYSGHNIGMMMVDIDHFKKVNDTYGHDVGDQVLKQTASILESSIRSHDILIRWGGEEFLIIFHIDDAQTLKIIGKNLCSSVATTPYQQIDHLSVSLGSAFRSHQNETIESMITRADRALYRAKTEGRNQFWFDE